MGAMSRDIRRIFSPRMREERCSSLLLQYMDEEGREKRPRFSVVFNLHKPPSSHLPNRSRDCVYGVQDGIWQKKRPIVISRIETVFHIDISFLGIVVDYQ